MRVQLKKKSGVMAKYQIKLLNVTDEQENAIRELYSNRGWVYEAEREVSDCGAVTSDCQSDAAGSEQTRTSGFNRVFISGCSWSCSAETGITDSSDAEVNLISENSVTSQFVDVPSLSVVTDRRSAAPARHPLTSATDRRGVEKVPSGSESYTTHSNETESNSQCLFCFCSPCVTSARQCWLGNGQAAHARNAGVRKKLYRKFWAMMNRRGAWRHPLYLEKRQDSISRVNPLHVNINREIMPDCILHVVRTLYPNPKGIPYQGHNWW